MSKGLSRRSASPSFVFAADLGGTKVSAALVSPQGRIASRITEPVDLASWQAPVSQMVRLAHALRANTPNGQICAAGVAVPGLVRPNGKVWAPNLPGWKAVPLARLLRARLRVPVVVESDRNAGVIGEGWHGAARGKSDVVVLMIGTGIGAGILSGGRLVRGAHELSGCAGWMTFSQAQTKEARRGGQLESLAAGPAVAQRGGFASAAAAAQSARRGNRAARKLFAEVGTQLGLAVANIISLFDPQVVVLTGGLADAADLFLPRLRQTALQHAQRLAAKQVRIVTSRLGGDANLLGMARLAIESYQRQNHN